AGDSSESSASNAVTPATVPGAPTGASAEGGNAQATVSFTAPANNGGAAITGYTVTSSPGAITATGSGSPITVTGLSNGTSYTFTVHATNTAGDSSESSASNAVTPLAAGTTALVSVNTNEVEGDTYSRLPDISAAGRYVVFISDATNLAGTTDNNATSDVFVRDVVNGTTTRVSVASDGTEANGPSFEAAISGDGTRVVFTSSATNLAPGDTNDRSDVFVHDMATGS